MHLGGWPPPITTTWRKGLTTLGPTPIRRHQPDGLSLGPRKSLWGQDPNTWQEHSKTGTGLLLVTPAQCPNAGFRPRVTHPSATSSVGQRCSLPSPSQNCPWPEGAVPLQVRPLAGLARTQRQAKVLILLLRCGPVLKGHPRPTHASHQQTPLL